MSMFYRIEEELQRRRDQCESVKGKDTPFRVEFRFKGGSKAYEYFETLEQAVNADDHLALHGYPGGIEYPSSRQIQKRGPRGGWNHCGDIDLMIEWINEIKHLKQENKKLRACCKESEGTIRYLKHDIDLLKEQIRQKDFEDDDYIGWGAN